VNITHLKVIASNAIFLLLISHLPHLLVFLGLDFIILVVWVALIENIPLLFLNVREINWFVLGEFGIKSYTWQGFFISIICKYIFFVILSSLMSLFKFLKNKS